MFKIFCCFSLTNYPKVFSNFRCFKVIYVHTSKEDSSSDTFRVMASNGLKNREAEISILISTVDSELPTLVLGRSTTESSVSSPVSLLRGSSVSISQMIIRIEDPDSPKGKTEHVQLCNVLANQSFELH